MGARGNFRRGGGQAQKSSPHREKTNEKTTTWKKVTKRPKHGEKNIAKRPPHGEKHSKKAPTWRKNIAKRPPHGEKVDFFTWRKASGCSCPHPPFAGANLIRI